MQHWDETVLTMAVWSGDKATVAALIEAGANVNTRDNVRAVCWALHAA